MAQWVPLATADPLAGGTFTETWDVHIEVAISQDGTNYAPWTPLKSQS